MKKITDKQRLDWLESKKYCTEYDSRGMWSIWDGNEFSESKKGLRNAIDAEIKKESEGLG